MYPLDEMVDRAYEILHLLRTRAVYIGLKMEAKCTVPQR